MFFVLFMRIKNIWVKVACLSFVLFMLFMHIKKDPSESCLFTFYGFYAFYACEIFSWKQNKKNPKKTKQKKKEKKKKNCLDTLNHITTRAGKNTRKHQGYRMVMWDGKAVKMGDGYWNLITKDRISLWKNVKLC